MANGEIYPFISIQVKDKDIREVMETVREVADKLYECHRKMSQLGMIVVGEETASDDRQSPAED